MRRARTQQPPRWEAGGSVPAAPQTPAAVAGRARNRTHRHRHQLKPWWTLTLLPAAAAMHLLLWPPMFLRLLVILAAGVLFGWRQRVVRTRWDERAYALACVAAVSLWLLFAARTGLWDGLGRFSLLAFLLGWVPLSWIWWDHHRIRPHAEPRYADEWLSDPFEVKWRTRVTPVLDWTISGREEIAAGARYTVQLVPGQTIEDAQQARAKAASLLRISRRRLTFEPLPGDGPGDSGDESVIQLLLTDMINPHHDSQMWEGPTLDRATGLYRHGVYPDGPAFLRLFQVEDGTPHRACNGLWTGTTGSGKSRGNAVKIAEHLLSGMFVVWYGDGKDGASAPELEDHVDWYCDSADETIQMLRAAWKVMKVRARIVKKLHQAAFRGEHVILLGSAQLPYLQIVLDEAQEFLKHPIVARLVKALLRMGNEVAMGMDLLTQVPLLHELGAQAGDGGAEVIRAMAKSGNVVVYKAEDNFTGTVTLTSSLSVNPRDLPPLQGSCYVAAHTARAAVCRGYYASKAALHGWLKDAPLVELDVPSARAAGEDYVTRFRRAVDNDIAPEEIDLGDLDAELAMLLGEALPGHDAPGGAEKALTVRQAVLDVVRAAPGPIRREQITTDLAARGLTAAKSTIDQALAWWRKLGHIDNPEHGLYELVTRETSDPVPTG